MPIRAEVTVDRQPVPIDIETLRPPDCFQYLDLDSRFTALLCVGQRAHPHDCITRIEFAELRFERFRLTALDELAQTQLQKS